MQSRVLAILVAVVLALVATAALVVYVNGADRRAISRQEPRMVWVAAQLIKAGTSGQTARNTGQIKQVPVPNKSVVAGAVLSMPQIENRYAAVDIVPAHRPEPAGIEQARPVRELDEDEASVDDENDDHARDDEAEP